MSRATALARGRSKAEASFVDACTIRRVTGTTVDDHSGEPTPTYLSPNPYSGKCRVQQALVQSTREDAGEDNVLLLRLEVQLPVVGSQGIEVGDVLTITASVNDPDLPGRVFLVRDLAHKTDATARRIQCTERTS